METLEKKLNVNAVTERMIQKGFSQTEISERLGVSKATVSTWLKPDKFPRPKHLLQLGRLLGLKYDDLVQQELSGQPMVAFRKSGNYKITTEQLEKYNFVSRLLHKLVPHLPFDNLSSPATLKEPKNDYEYIERAASSVRRSVNHSGGVVNFEDLIKLFDEHYAILIPVLWGKKHYKNATHIFLPDSLTTWIFINLDTKIFDFKFWLAHELGHAKAPQLINEEGEIFADRFAGALLFPRESAEIAYREISKKSSSNERLLAVSKLAKEHVVSPITIYKQTESFANHTGLPSLEMEKAIYAYTTTFNKDYPLLSETLFKTSEPSIEAFCTETEKIFGTPFFKCLKTYLLESNESAKFVANLLDVSIEDAQEFYRFLAQND